ncbi:hypothetical protein B566_EDAN006696 [Ephemera danica]|nr:hypothetical protein B566_EDAN006696 [Ephemera danica]
MAAAMRSEPSSSSSSSSSKPVEPGDEAHASSSSSETIRRSALDITEQAQLNFVYYGCVRTCVEGGSFQRENMSLRIVRRLTWQCACSRVHSRAVHSKRAPEEIAEMLRVDHAGEFGANRIYAGQLAVLRHTKSAPLIQHMWDQEKEHKKMFETLLEKHRVRPTALMPFWNVAGFMLGAVEAVIVDHYNDQLRELATKDPEKHAEIMETIQKCRDDEQEHHDTGIDHGAEQAPFYQALTAVIKLGCKTAIALSTKI